MTRKVLVLPQFFSKARVLDTVYLEALLLVLLLVLTKAPNLFKGHVI